MTNRRQFVQHTAVGVATIVLAGIARGAQKKTGSLPSTPFDMTRIKSAVRRDDTIVRHGGDAAFTSITWTADDKQIVTAGDGAGWPEMPKDHYYASRLFAVEGGPKMITVHDLPNYPDISIWGWMDAAGSTAMQYGLYALAVGERIYVYLCTSSDRPLDPVGEGAWCQDSSAWKGNAWDGARIIYSPDNGQTWCNRDGTTPVALLTQDKKSRENMTFLNEPNYVFATPVLLQMGKAYEENTDGYIYAYSGNGYATLVVRPSDVETGGNASEVVMFRVPKEDFLDRSKYEFFSKRRPDGTAEWVKDISGRGGVCTLPNSSHIACVVYNAPLGIYLMTSGSSHYPVNKPSYMAILAANSPWGPWKTVYEETSWRNPEDPTSFPSTPVIAPKWIAKDGKSFWLVWTEMTGHPHMSADEAMYHVHGEREFTKVRRLWWERNRFFGFNAQRVDLVVV